MTASTNESLVYALGDSHVRTCSYHSRFLPLYVGPGFANCFLTAELAAAAQNKILTNIARLPQDCAVLLCFGEPDVRFHAEDRFGSRSAGDEEALKTAVARYASALTSVRDGARVRLAVMSVPPSIDATRSRLAVRYNGYLTEACARLGVTFIDLWSNLADGNGMLQSVFDADGIHLNPSMLPALSRVLREKHIVARDFPDGPDFSWSFNYRIPLNDGMETRFWGDKANAAKADRLVEYVSASVPDAQAVSAAVLDCREGYIALALARGGVRRLAAADADAAKRVLAREVARFARCPELRIMAPDALEAEARRSAFDIVIAYSPRNTAALTPQHLERMSTLGKRSVIVADRRLVARHPRLADAWAIEERVFGPESDEIILHSKPG